MRVHVWSESLAKMAKCLFVHWWDSWLNCRHLTQIYYSEWFSLQWSKLGLPAPMKKPRRWWLKATPLNQITLVPSLLYMQSHPFVFICYLFICAILPFICNPCSQLLISLHFRWTSFFINFINCGIFYQLTWNRVMWLWAKQLWLEWHQQGTCWVEVRDG